MFIDPIVAKLLASLIAALLQGAVQPAPPALLGHVQAPVVWSGFWHPYGEPGNETDLVVTLGDGTSYYGATSSAVSPPKP